MILTPVGTLPVKESLETSEGGGKQIFDLVN